MRLTLAEADIADRPCRVRLYFAESEPLQKGDRVFDVTLQGKMLVKNLDVLAEAGGLKRGMVKEFRGVPVGNELHLALVPTPSSSRSPLICGIEVVAEEGQ